MLFSNIDYGKIAGKPGKGGLENALAEAWCADYRKRTASKGEIYEVEHKEGTRTFHYLFDVARDRVVAAYGYSAGKSTEKRPASRMKDHPLKPGKGLHRGHLMAHSLGGGTDINLVPQQGSVNVGPFRELERLAVANPKSLYFVYLLYENVARPIPAGKTATTPAALEQGLIPPGSRAPMVRRHGNG